MRSDRISFSKSTHNSPQTYLYMKSYNSCNSSGCRFKQVWDNTLSVKRNLSLLQSDTKIQSMIMIQNWAQISYNTPYQAHKKKQFFA